MEKISYEDFNKKVNLDDHTTLTDFLISKFGENSPLSKILKLTHQTIIITWLGYLGELALNSYGYRLKDLKGSWFVHLKRYYNKKLKCNVLSVTHKRSEIGEFIYLKI
jgi:hypothetical protein